MGAGNEAMPGERGRGHKFTGTGHVFKVSPRRDMFARVVAALDEEPGMAPASCASRETLLRRLAFLYDDVTVDSVRQEFRSVTCPRELSASCR